MIKWLLIGAAAYEFSVGVSTWLYGTYPPFALVAQLPSVASIVDPALQTTAGTSVYSYVSAAEGGIDVAVAFAIYYFGIRSR